jgi:hypothetical protein
MKSNFHLKKKNRNTKIEGEKTCLKKKDEERQYASSSKQSSSGGISKPQQVVPFAMYTS